MYLLFCSLCKTFSSFVLVLLWICTGYCRGKPEILTGCKANKMLCTFGLWLLLELIYTLFWLSQLPFKKSKSLRRVKKVVRFEHVAGPYSWCISILAYFVLRMMWVVCKLRHLSPCWMNFTRDFTSLAILISSNMAKLYFSYKSPW